VFSDFRFIFGQEGGQLDIYGEARKLIFANILLRTRQKFNISLQVAKFLTDK
jgi:hypothetical protein